MQHNSYTIAKKQYDYLLPVFGFAAQGPTKLVARGNDFFFIGTHSEYLDALNRCLYI